MEMPFSRSQRTLVSPETNQSSSPMTDFRWIFFVVTNGKPSASENRIWWPNTLRVPVPVRSPFSTPSSRIRCIRSRYSRMSAEYQRKTARSVCETRSMKSREYETSPSEVRTFALLQLGLTAVFLTLLFFAFEGTNADRPPWWLIAVLLVAVAISAVLAERVWLSARPMTPGGDPDEMRSRAVGIFAGQIVRKL